MKRNRILISCAVALFLIVPAASHAQNTDAQSNIISLLQQIISLQKQWIDLLQNEITQLSARITALQTQLTTASGTNSSSHVCPIVNPPACSTTLTVTRDSYNCVTSYDCALASPTTPTTQTTGSSCVVHRHCGDLVVPNGGIAGNSRACGAVCAPPSQCVNGGFVQVGTYATPHQYETSCPDDPYSRQSAATSQNPSPARPPTPSPASPSTAPPSPKPPPSASSPPSKNFRLFKAAPAAGAALE